MDISEFRKKIIRALDDARRDAASRRAAVDEAVRAYEAFLSERAVPLMRQAVSVLNASGHPFVLHTPADSVRMVAETSPETFLELSLDRHRARPEVVGRVSVARGRQGVIVEERPVASGKAVSDLTDEDVSAFIVSEVPKLVVRP